MQFLSSHSACQAALLGFVAEHGSSLSEALRARLVDAAGHVNLGYALARAAECLYANRAMIDAGPARDAALAVTAQLAGFLSRPDQMLFGFGQPTPVGGTRGGGVVLAMLRELGEAAPMGIAWPDPAADPAPSADWTV